MENIKNMKSQIKQMFRFKRKWAFLLLFFLCGCFSAAEKQNGSEPVKQNLTVCSYETKGLKIDYLLYGGPDGQDEIDHLVYRIAVNMDPIYAPSSGQLEEAAARIAREANIEKEDVKITKNQKGIVISLTISKEKIPDFIEADCDEADEDTDHEKTADPALNSDTLKTLLEMQGCSCRTNKTP